MAIATGQFTIIDYNDALSLTGFIGSNHPKTQAYNPDNASYTPNWTSTNLVLTPSLFKLGTSTDIITDTAVQSVSWFYNNNGTETAITAGANYVYSGTKSQILIIKVNDLASIAARDYICKVVYRDVTTGLDLTYKMGITFNKVTNGGGIADAVAWCPDGNVFKNDSVATLKAQCDLWRGSVIDTTSITYQWYMQDSTITSASGSLYDAGAGAGWRKLSDVAGSYTGTTSATITVFPAAIASYGVFKCQIKDTDSASNTYNQYFYDTVSLIDLSDPLQVSITSTGGDVFKNGVGSTTLTAKVYQAGAEVDSAGTKYTYKWYRYNENGVLDANFGGTGVNYKSGKTLSVGDTDVTVKATFQVEVN